MRVLSKKVKAAYPIPKKKLKLEQAEVSSFDHMRDWLIQASEGELDNLTRWLSKRKRVTAPRIPAFTKVVKKCSWPKCEAP